MIHAEFTDIMVIGTGRLASGIVTNLMQAHAVVYVLSEDAGQDRKYIADNIADWKRYKDIVIDPDRVQYFKSVEEMPSTGLAIGITGENLACKRQLLHQLEQVLSTEALIAVNTESFLLGELQQESKYPERIVGMNWSEPVHTSAFLEIIANNITPKSIIESLETAARNHWNKDPYSVYCGYSVKARLMAAFAREALYLVENGYAAVEDIDRACRNDAGYYLPFAGNCRYMDLMGTYAYGLVMKDLNPELSKQDQPPAFFSELLAEGKTGMEADAGFYSYKAGDMLQWQDRFRKFSFEIKAIIDKYPFNYLKEKSKSIKSKITLDE